MDNTTNIEKLRWRCYQIIPLVFDEALSYYEVLCKGAKKINELIDFTNEMSEIVQDNTEDIASLRAIVGEGSIDDRIYGAELTAKAYTDEVTDNMKAKSGAVLFTGSMAYGNTHQPCVSGDFKINDYKTVVVYGDRPYGDGGVVCSVTPFVEEGSPIYIVSGVGNLGLDMGDTTVDYLLRVYLKYDSTTNELTRSQSTKPGPESTIVHDTITKIIGVA